MISSQFFFRFFFSLHIVVRARSACVNCIHRKPQLNTSARCGFRKPINLGIHALRSVHRVDFGCFQELLLCEVVARVSRWEKRIDYYSLLPRSHPWPAEGNSAETRSRLLGSVLMLGRRKVGPAHSSSQGPHSSRTSAVAIVFFFLLHHRIFLSRFETKTLFHNVSGQHRYQRVSILWTFPDFTAPTHQPCSLDFPIHWSLQVLGLGLDLD